MSTFFVQWALWEKMTFCLGLAIVFAIILGLAKNFYSRWRLRNYSTVEERLLDPTPAMIEARLGHKTDAPFGIRALESGVEIEGVWISRSNLTTPVPSRAQSPVGSTSSSFLDEPTTPSFAIMEGPRPRIESTQSSAPSWYAPSKRSSDMGSTASWTIDTNGLKHIDVYRPRPVSSPVTTQRHHSARSDRSVLSDDSSLDGTLKRALTASSDDDYKPKSTSTMATSPSTSIDGSEPSKLSRDSTDQPHHSGNLEGKEQKADLGLLYTHRLSHVAETGQLVPRSKRSPRTSGDWSRTAPARAARPRHPPISMHNRRLSRSLPTTPTDESKDPFDLVQGQDRRASLPSGSLAAPNPPEHKVPVSKTTPDIDHEPDADVMDIVRFYEKHNGAISAIASLPRPEATYAPPAFEHERGSEILCKVNDSFEILRPGTISDRQESQPSSRDVSRDRSKRRTRRLSKERPQAGSRDRNSFIEVLYGDERRPRF